MTLLFPVKESNSLINWKLCEYLQKYIIEKKGEAELSRKSENAPEINPLILKTSKSPDIYLQIQTGYTGTPYLVQGANYSALIGAINYELYLYFEKPEDIGSGLKILKEDCLIGANNDIVINLPALDSYTEDKLEYLAQCLVEAMYAPPVRTITEPDDTPGNFDPYFYRCQSEHTWSPETREFGPSQDISKCSGSIIEEKIKLESATEEHPINILKITGIFPKEYYEDEEPQVPPKVYPKQHYTWKIPVKDAVSGANTLILYAKGTGTLYSKIGTSGAAYGSENYTEKTKEVSSSDYIKIELNFSDISISDDTTIEIGIMGSGELSITAIWFTKDTDNYSIYPQGYRDQIPKETQTEIPTKPIPALTSATTLEDRDAEKIENPAKEEEETTSDSPTGGSSIDSPEGFTSALEGILGQLSDASETAGNVLDLNSVLKLDTSSMLDKIKNTPTFAGKINLSKAKDKLEALKSGAEQQAKSLITAAKDKIKGKNMSLSPAKLEEAKSKFGSIIEQGKKASAEATAGLNTITEAAKTKANELKNNATSLTAGLQQQANALKESATSKLATIQAQVDAAKKAVDTVKSTTTANAISQIKNSL